MSKEDYRLLELDYGDNNLSVEMVKKAYKKMVTKYHPDRNNNSSQASEKTQMIIKAYQNILDGWNYRKPKGCDDCKSKTKEKINKTQTQTQTQNRKVNLEKKSNSRHNNKSFDKKYNIDLDFKKITKKYFAFS